MYLHLQYNKARMKKPKNYRLDDDLIEKMAKIAHLENRTVTNLIETVMGDYCDEKFIYQYERKCPLCGKVPELEVDVNLFNSYSFSCQCAGASSDSMRWAKKNYWAIVLGKKRELQQKGLL